MDAEPTNSADVICLACGEMPLSVGARDLPVALVDMALRWTEFVNVAFDHPDGQDALVHRSQPDTWSALEYACHVRDMVGAANREIELVLLADLPPLLPWDGDAALADGAYAAQHPHAVVDDLLRTTRELAACVQALTPSQLERVGVRGTGFFSTLAIARNALHEGVHHLADARRIIPVTSS